MEVKKKKSKKWIIVLCIIAAIVILIIIGANSLRKKAMAALESMTSTETAEVEYRDLVSTVSATGTIVGADEQTVKSTLSGVVVENVLVEVGDTVHEGDVLCEFETKDLEDKLETAVNTDAENDLTTAYNIESAEQALVDAQNDYLIKIPDLEGAIDRTRHDYEVAGVNLQNARTDYEKNPNTQTQSALYTAETNANNAFNNYDQALEELETQKVKLQEAIEKAEYDLQLAKIKSENASSEQSVESAKENMEKSQVTAPITGVVTSVSVAAGDTYSGGAIAVIDDVSSYEVSAKVDEYDVGKIQVGQRAVIRTNATGDTEYAGKVLSVAPKSTSSSSSSTSTASLSSSSSQDVTYEVRLSLEDLEDIFKLDMTAKVSIVTEEKNHVLTVPYDAVQTDDEGNFYVEVVDQSAAVPSDGTDTAANQTEQDENAQSSGQKPGNNPQGGMMPPGQSGSASANLPGAMNTKRVPVEKGIESAYYIEVISDELEEGMEVLVPNTDSSLNDMMVMMGQRGPMGGF